jgi:hypothetical protein
VIACISERRFHGKRIRDALISLGIVLFAVSGVTQQRPGQAWPNS